MNWYKGSIPEAVGEAKKNNKILLVYIEGSDAMSTQMTATYNDSSVASKLSSEDIIALNITANSVPYQQFCAVYPVLVIPTSYFIRGNGEPIEIVTGGLSPDEFSVKVEKVLELYRAASTAQKVKTPDAAATKPKVTAEPSTSAASESSQQATTSQTETAVESSASIQERLERAKVLVEAQREKKAVEEKEKERREEVERRNVGKAMQQAQQSKKDDEMREWAKNRAKEKEEERLAREKVKAMIAQDRAERAVKYQMTREAEQAERESQLRRKEETERAVKDAAMISNEARIQFRLPDGSFMTHTFPADASLRDARNFVIQEVKPPFSNFSLCTTFPRRHFTESNYAESFRDLQLAPSAVLLILPSQSVSNVTPDGGGFLSNLIWMLLSPFTSAWNLIRTYLPWGSSEPSAPPQRGAPQSVPQQSSAQPSTSTSQSDVRRRPPPQGKKEPSFSKQEGNIFRINNQSDDEENNTWNGNSTQQM